MWLTGGDNLGCVDSGPRKPWKQQALEDMQKKRDEKQHQHVSP